MPDIEEDSSRIIRGFLTAASYLIFCTAIVYGLKWLVHGIDLWGEIRGF